MRLPVRLLAGLLVWAALSPPRLYAETGHDAWLRYAALTPAAQTAADLPSALTVFESAPPSPSARDELVRGVRGMLARDVRVSAEVPAARRDRHRHAGSASPVGAHAGTGWRPCAGRVPDQDCCA